MDNIFVENWLDNVSIAPVSAADSSNLSPSEYGDLVHSILRSIDNSEQYESQLKTRLSLNKVSEETNRKIEHEFRALFTNETFKLLFDTPGTRLKERDLITLDGKIIRPDCVIVGSDRIILFDYKTGIEEPSHEKQILEYKKQYRKYRKKAG